jgi:homoserine O-acetyltransferase
LLLHAASAALLCLTTLAAAAADYPTPNEGDWVARDFRFHTGHVMPELRLHYTTVGTPAGQPVLILHGTTGSGAPMLSPAFAGSGTGSSPPSTIGVVTAAPDRRLVIRAVVPAG